jgi:hypothetical protein
MLIGIIKDMNVLVIVMGKNFTGILLNDHQDLSSISLVILGRKGLIPILIVDLDSNMWIHH